MKVKIIIPFLKNWENSICIQFEFEHKIMSMNFYSPMFSFTALFIMYMYMARNFWSTDLFVNKFGLKLFFEEVMVTTKWNIPSLDAHSF